MYKMWIDEQTQIVSDNRIYDEAIYQGNLHNSSEKE